MESKNRGRDLVDMYLSLFMKNSHLIHLLYLLDSLYPGKANIFICSLLKTPTIHNDLNRFEVKLSVAIAHAEKALIFTTKLFFLRIGFLSMHIDAHNTQFIY